MYKIIEVKQSVFEDNNKDANKLREECKDKGVFLFPSLEVCTMNV